VDKVNGPRDRVLLRDVARRANVSGSTASRALSDDPRISRATRELVKAAAADLHYVPNAAARSLRARRTRTLGLLLPDLRDPVHGQIASAFEEQARTEGYCVIVVAGERDVLRERLALRIFAEHGTDGVAVVSSVVSPRELRERVDPDRLILVWPDHRSMPRNGGPPEPGVISTDDSSGVRAAVNHLIDQGCRRIVYASGGVRASNTIRMDATAATMRSRKIGPAMRSLVATAGLDGVAGLSAEVGADIPDAHVC
jgi:DNA-binding LacI/PurR family transcriptional regulator